MSNPIIVEHNSETNEVIEREMTDAEYAAHLKSFEPLPLTEEQIAAEEAKTALLEKLGITADEAKLLLS